MSSLSNEIPSSSRAPVAVVAVGLVMAAGVAMFTVTGTKARQSGIAVVDVEDQALSDDQRSRRSSVGSDGTLSQEIEDIPFTMNDLMKAIPEECFEKSLAWSTFYCLRDFAIVALLYHFQPNFFEFGLAGKFVWWNVVGFYGWCLFVVGHDCGHGTFSKYAWVNEIVGHITHAPLLVPYNGWRITHRHHHQYHNDIDRDHSWRPFGAEALDALPAPLKFMRFSLFVLLLWPVYLLAPRHDYGFSGCHFWPWNPLFKPEERAGVAVSALAVVGMMGLLSACATEYGLGTVMELYGVPYLIFAAWLNLVTLMQHTDPKVSYFRGETWSYLRGALSTVDRTYKQIIDPFNLGYGKIIDHLHHNISDGHVVHHIFFTQIPHYNLKKATEAIKPLLGKYYMFDDTPILNAFAKTMEGCWFVEEEGGAVMYKGKTEYKEWEKDSKSAPSLPQI
jgi:omega-3 fatty acid desaturase (delta-15 desaturase)